MDRDIKVICKRVEWLKELSIELESYINEIKNRFSKLKIKDKEVEKMLKSLDKAKKEVNKQSNNLLKRIKILEIKNE